MVYQWCIFTTSRLTYKSKLWYHEIVRDDYNIYLDFHSKQDFLFPFYIYPFFIFLHFKIYCVKCRRVTEIENITTSTFKNGRLTRRCQCGKTKTQFLRKDAAGGSFLNTLVNILPFEMHLPGYNFTGPEQNSTKDWIRMERQSCEVYQ